MFWGNEKGRKAGISEAERELKITWERLISNEAYIGDEVATFIFPFLYNIGVVYIKVTETVPKSCFVTWITNKTETKGKWNVSNACNKTERLHG